MLLLAICVHIGFAVKLEEKFKWKEVSYAWPSDAAKEAAITSKRYIVENNLPLGLDIWRDKLFVTVPRYTSIAVHKKFSLKIYGQKSTFTALFMQTT